MICTKCKLEKDETFFYKDKRNKSGFYSHCKSCFKKVSDKWRTSNPEKLAKIRRYPNQRFLFARSIAKKRGLVWEIPKEQYFELIKNTCTYCEESLPEVGTGLDRKDSSIGYVLENVVPCCTRCNRMKNEHLTYDEMVLIWNRRKNL